MVSIERTATPRRRTAWTRFAQRWGWRAYALPILAAVTVLALVRGAPTRPTHARPQAAPTRSLGSPAHRVTVEGFSGSAAGFAAGSVPPPAPAVVNLGTDASSCATNSYRQLVLVSVRAQHLWACEGAKEVRSTPVTTGSVTHHDQTPRGSWRVQAKQRNRYLVGRGYRDYVKYWMPFDGDYGMHDASWQKMPFGSQDWPTGGSHGCVHLPTQTMAWMYSWAKPGTTVVTVER
ncbi:L,D-transpeptidase [uncultured Jatrophihabitans sp.]|uniref:L,D-transpeptidase n=1 Tax=uncultured Jatrophihabitans sp. TaxID=1610747 RepID=UPI0035CC66E9